MLNFQYHMKEDNAEIQIKIPVIYCILVWRFQILRTWKVSRKRVNLTASKGPISVKKKK